MTLRVQRRMPAECHLSVLVLDCHRPKGVVSDIYSRG